MTAPRHGSGPTWAAGSSEAPKEHRPNVSGVVKSVDGRELTLETGKGEIQVDTVGMPYDPIAPGRLGISVGDRIWVSGEMDKGFFESKEILAETIITLDRDETRKSS